MLLRSKFPFLIYISRVRVSRNCPRDPEWEDRVGRPFDVQGASGIYEKAKQHARDRTVKVL